MRPEDDMMMQGKMRHWRRSLSRIRDQNFSVPNSLGGSCRNSLLSLDSLNPGMLNRSSSLSSVIRFAELSDFDDVDSRTVCNDQHVYENFFEEDEYETDGVVSLEIA